MASPTYTPGAAANVLASQSLAASGTVSFNVDLSASFTGVIQIGATFGTIAATAGLKIEIFNRVGSTPVADTVASAGSFVLTAITGSQSQSIRRPTGKYTIKLSNLDTTNGLTLVYATMDTVSGVA